jgi:hypothetical protein
MLIAKPGLLATGPTVAALASAPVTSADPGAISSCPQGFALIPSRIAAPQLRARTFLPAS